MSDLPNIQPALIRINIKDLKNFDINQRVIKEYLKNALLKYLGMIIFGNEFDKILEIVLFARLQVSEIEIKYLDDKRIISSFYFNL